MYKNININIVRKLMQGEIKIQGKIVNMLQFADDIAVLTESEKTYKIF